MRSQPAISADGPNLDTDLPTEQAASTERDRSRLLDLLDEGCRFESMLSRLSATFINLPAEEVDGQIERGLQQIVEFLGIEWSSLCQFSADGAELIVTHSYTIPGFAPFPHINLATVLPWYTSQIRQGILLRFRRLPEDAPPEAVAEREHVRRNGGPRSHLAIPFRVGDSILGGIGIGSFREERDWPDDLVMRLRLVGEIFANALARKRAEETDARLRDQLALAARVTLMGELAASIAHEVNQPLCAIVSNAQALQRMLAGGFDMEEMREALKDIACDSQRASTVLHRIRNLLKKTATERTAVDVNDLVRETAALARAEMARRGVMVRLQLMDGLPLLLADRIQLQQVLLNLLANGADAMEGMPPARREIVLRSAVDADTVLVAVRDAGAGLDPAHLDRIFDAFFTTKPGGMGMGLAICKSIVQSHGGRLSAAPNDGPGTTFQLRLPVSRGTVS
jgi:signal transduction histidine kinase